MSKTPLCTNQTAESNAIARALVNVGLPNALIGLVVALKFRYEASQSLAIASLMAEGSENREGLSTTNQETIKP